MWQQLSGIYTLAHLYRCSKKQVEDTVHGNIGNPWTTVHCKGGTIHIVIVGLGETVYDDINGPGGTIHVVISSPGGTAFVWDRLLQDRRNLDNVPGHYCEWIFCYAYLVYH